ncbi:MAG: hypothetical protein LBR45_04850 [Bacteroidales bacterium]|jgi:hypothetical protein|nr:hypothetical protein [Bacteroidales bacterium]
MSNSKIYVLFLSLCSLGISTTASATDAAIVSSANGTNDTAALQQRIDELENKVDMLIRLQSSQVSQTTEQHAHLSIGQNENKGSGTDWQFKKKPTSGVMTRQRVNEMEYGGFVVTDNTSSISIGGLIVASAYEDFHEMANENAFVVSSIVMNDKLVPRTRFDASNSRFYINSDVHLGKFDYKTRFEFDFNGPNGTYAFRLRHAFVTFWHFIVGYTSSTFCDIPVQPEIFDNGGPSGSISRRQTKITYFHDLPKGWKIMLSLEDGQGDIYDTTDRQYGKSTRISPDFVVSIRWKSKHDDLTQISLSGVLHPISYENPIYSRQIALGGGVSFAARYAFTKKDYFIANLLYTNGASKYVNDPIDPYDALVTLAHDGNSVNIEKQTMYGGHLYYHHDWISSKLATDLGYSFIGVGRNHQATHIADSDPLYGHYGTLNLSYYPFNKVAFGFETIAGARKNIDGTTAFNVRLLLRALFSF